MDDEIETQYKLHTIKAVRLKELSLAADAKANGDYIGSESRLNNFLGSLASTTACDELKKIYIDTDEQFNTDWSDVVYAVNHAQHGAVNNEPARDYRSRMLHELVSQRIQSKLDAAWSIGLRRNLLPKD